MVSIPVNNKQAELEAHDSRCDDDVVQAICDAFLDCNGNNTEYHPYNSSCYRRHEDVVVSKAGHWRPSFMSSGSNCIRSNPEGTYEFTNTEMDAAVRILLEHGYYLFRFYMYGNWETYRFSPKADLGDGYTRVSRIPHFVL